VKGITRDKEYNLTKDTEGSKILYFSANPNGEAETVRIFHRPRKRLKKKILELDFREIAVKGRQAMGNLVTKYAVQKIQLKDEGVSTLGGLNVWFDNDVKRLNTEERGTFLGNFKGDDKILAIYQSGEYQLTNFDITNHFDHDILKIQKFDAEKNWTAVYFDAELNLNYLKRFEIEEADREVSFIGDNKDSKLILISEEDYPMFEITFGGKNQKREKEIIDAEEFITVKSYKAKGKRLSIYEIAEIIEIEPKQVEEPEDEENEETSDSVEETKIEFNDDPDFEVVQTDEEGNQIVLDL
jgi:topoisomerase-4 subunit A